jgi:hypothetical protein
MSRRAILALLSRALAPVRHTGKMPVLLLTHPLRRSAATEQSQPRDGTGSQVRRVASSSLAMVLGCAKRPIAKAFGLDNAILMPRHDGAHLS